MQEIRSPLHKTVGPNNFSLYGLRDLTLSSYKLLGIENSENMKKNLKKVWWNVKELWRKNEENMQENERIREYNYAPLYMAYGTKN